MMNARTGATPAMFDGSCRGWRRRTVGAIALTATGLVACRGGPTGVPRVLSGEWGGDGFSLSASPDSVAALFNCAYGSIRAPIRLSPRGEFSVAGEYVREVGPAALSNPARYNGQVRDDWVALRVSVTDTIFGTGTTELGPFVGRRDAEPRVFFCQ